MFKRKALILLLLLISVPLMYFFYNEIGFKGEEVYENNIGVESDSKLCSNEVEAEQEIELEAEKVVENIPILMYHVIKELPENGSNLYGLYVSPERFKKQLDELKSKGFNTVKMEDVYNHWLNNKPIPENPIVISFDDGYESAYNVALNALLERDMAGTFYIHTSAIGTSNYLIEEQIEEMHNKGMEIASHADNHIRLDDKDVNLEKELLESKKILENIIEDNINHFSYPYGVFNEEIINKLKEYGYKTAVTVKGGSANLNQGIYQLHRITVSYKDTPSELIKKITKNLQ